MLLLIAVLAIASAAFLLFRFSRRQQIQFSDQNPVLNEPPPNARPLFAPTDDELRRDRDASEAREIARREYAARSASRELVDNAVERWRHTKSRECAAEMLLVTAESGLAGDLSRAANEIVDEFHLNGIDRLTAQDLAALLDSHLRLLPPATNDAGELFWLRQEIARLNEVNVSE